MCKSARLALDGYRTSSATTRGTRLIVSLFPRLSHLVAEMPCDDLKAAICRIMLWLFWTSFRWMMLAPCYFAPSLAPCRKLSPMQLVAARKGHGASANGFGAASETP
ncbi:hypothetical protein THAR02_02657 [Trichoderma harzianum]|uniref:Uncharacterized protein n=1 Tax=Trichoderma harzianum TaxID=5544 RepID=A0A0F9XL29_TRIHA|nr:hypothetical protein THAR02_02657 [Trichoderma harzianum]